MQQSGVFLERNGCEDRCIFVMLGKKKKKRIEEKLACRGTRPQKIYLLL